MPLQKNSALHTPKQCPQCRQFFGPNPKLPVTFFTHKTYCSTTCAGLAHRKEHRKKDHPLYHCWKSMRTRCFNRKSRDYQNYGGRGITVCDRWRNDFWTFVADVGQKPGPEYSLDRFPDVNGHYEPGNVRWATPEEQGNNKRNNRMITFNGDTHSAFEWERILGMKQNQLQYRLDAGWSIERALTEPFRETEIKLTFRNETLTIAEWAGRDDLPVKLTADQISGRNERGWSPERIFTQPIGKRASWTPYHKRRQPDAWRPSLKLLSL